MARNSTTRRAPKKDRLATAEDYAALKFEGSGPEIREKLGTLAEWRKQADEEYATLCLAAAALGQNDTQLTETVQKMGAEMALDFLDGLRAKALKFEACAGIMKTTSARLLVALNRMVPTEKEAA